MRRIAFLCVVSACVLALVLVSCDMGGGGGGSGADFDATQYYTKAEVDGSHYTKAEVDERIQMVVFGEESTSAAFDQATTSDPATQYFTWTPPSNVQVAIVRITWSVTGPGKDVKVYVGFQSPAQDLESARQKATCCTIVDGLAAAIGNDMIVVFVQASESMYAWVEFDGGGGLGANVTICPQMYLRTGFAG